MLIHRAWEGPEPAWVRWTGQAVAATSPTAYVMTRRLSPDLPGPTPARRSNVHRLEVLMKHGGLWLDCDMVPLVDLTSLHDEPWMGYSDGMLRPGAMFFPEGDHPLLADVLARVLREPERPLAHLIAESPYRVLAEPRVLPHDTFGRWIIGSQTPLAVHLWLSSGKLLGNG